MKTFGSTFEHRTCRKIVRLKREIARHYAGRLEDRTVDACMIPLDDALWMIAGIVTETEEETAAFLKKCGE